MWWAVLQERGIEDMDLTAAMTEILKLVSEIDPVHDRRVRMMNVKKGSDDHSVFLYNIEQTVGVAEFSSMTQDELIAHLFISGGSDMTMSKIATDWLAKEGEKSISTLRTQIRAAEASSWYSNTKPNQSTN